MSGFFQVTFKKKNGNDVKVVVPPSRIFGYPEETDDPLIFWVYEKQFAPAFTCRKGDQTMVVMNFHGLKGMEDCPEDIEDVGIYLSAVLIEELTHCAIKTLRNHKGWISILKTLQREVSK